MLMKRFDGHGNSHSEVMAELVRYYDLDQHYCEGHIMGSMCTTPETIAREAFIMFMEANLGNPGLCRGTVEMEQRVLEMLLDLLGLDPELPGNSNAGGQIIGGGTEANITALWIARNLTGKKEVIFPESAHFSLHKAADLLGMKPRIVPLTETYTANIEKVHELIGKETAVMVGIAGTTELGQVDPIREMGKIARDLGVPLHVDAAFGGFVLPFVEDFHDEYDFRVPGVTSIGTDPHKMGLATIPAGILLLRDRVLLDGISVGSPYLTSEKNRSLAGTRNSAPVASTYAVMRHMGREGYMKVVNRCMDLTRYLAVKLEELGLEKVIEPRINVLAVTAKDPGSIIKEMRKKGWILSRASHPPSVRFVIMPHIRKEHIDGMVADLSSILDGRK